jgi:hypothetical protein
MIKRIHVNQHNIRANGKDGGNRPCITVKTYKSNTYGHDVMIYGESVVRYRPEHPLSCGAKVWIETEALVTVFNKENDTITQTSID